MELVSVIIPAYNYAQYLPDAIRSCLAQTYQPVEIIVVDDGSTDSTRDVAHSFPTVKYIYQENRGVSAARNIGLRHAQGEYIQFLDADDTISPTKIEQCLQVFKSHPDSGLVYTDYVIFDSDLRRPARKQHSRWAMPEGTNTLPALIRHNPYFQTHCPLIPRRSLEAIGGFNENLRAAEDWYMWVRLAGIGLHFRYIDAPLAQYRWTPNSMSRDLLLIAYGKLMAVKALKEVPEVANAVNLDETLALNHLNLAMRLWQFRSRAEARQNIRLAIQLQAKNRGRRRLLILWSYFMPAPVALWLQRAFGRTRKFLGVDFILKELEKS